ncbi:hypothetical protein KKA08_04740 [bacterium]|nr:hypothetical protein [bacterium]
MAVTEAIPTEVEVFGVTYERYALDKLFARLVPKHGISTVLEHPASGAKAMPSLYSLGFAQAGCQVTLADAEEEGTRLWSEVGLHDRLEIVDGDELERTERQWDLCWNFMVLPTAEDPRETVNNLVQRSSKWVLFVHVNRFNVGFNMHRTVHKVYKIPWSHGDIRFFSPFQTGHFLKECGLKDISWGVVDSPPWPDSPGFRDLRLHRMGDKPKKWESPYVDHLKSGQFPGWLKYVYAVERFPIPTVCKLPYSHLFYIMARVDRG